MNYIQQVVLSLFDAIETLLIIVNLFGENYFNRLIIRKISLVILVVLIISKVSTLTNNILAFLINGITFIILIKLITKVKYSKIIIGYMLCSVIIVPIQIFYIDIVEALYSKPISMFVLGIVIHTMTVGTLLFINRNIALQFIIDPKILQNRIFKLILINLVIVSFCLLLISWLNFDFFLVNILISLIVLLIVIVINSLVLFAQHLRNNELKTINMYERQVGAIEELVYSMRKKQHEYDNYVQALKSCLYNIKEANYFEARHVLNRYLTDIEDETKLIGLLKISNIILGGFIYSKIQEAEKKQIHIIHSIDNYNFYTNLEDYELIAIVGILVDNAIEASRIGDMIYFNIFSEGEYNVIQVLNKFHKVVPEDTKLMMKSGFTTKGSASRGFGLSNLKQILKKNNGELLSKNIEIDNINYISFSAKFE